VIDRVRRECHASGPSPDFEEERVDDPSRSAVPTGASNRIAPSNERHVGRGVEIGRPVDGVAGRSGRIVGGASDDAAPRVGGGTGRVTRADQEHLAVVA
jgi:hypothetical protein